MSVLAPIAHGGWGGAAGWPARGPWRGVPLLGLEFLLLRRCGPAPPAAHSRRRLAALVAQRCARDWVVVAAPPRLTVPVRSGPSG